MALELGVCLDLCARYHNPRRGEAVVIQAGVLPEDI